MPLPLSPQQQRVLDAQNNLLVVGGPGSGKTTVALLKARAEMAGLHEGQYILFLSFSNSAVAQINAASTEILQKADYRQIRVQTFHSLCFFVLRHFAGLMGIRHPLAIHPPEEEATLKARLGLKSDEELRLVLDRHAHESGQISFDLFASFAVATFSRSRQLLSQFSSCYPLILVDEFQDTDEFQWNLVKLLGQGSRLVCLADPLQRIYGFRPGVSPTRVEDYKIAFNPETVDLGSSNHRSSGSAILSAADAVVSGERIPRTDDVTLRPYKFWNQVSYCLKTEVLRMRANLTKKKSVVHPRICILCRTNQTARFLSTCLNKTTPTCNFSVRHGILLDTNRGALCHRFLCELLAAEQSEPVPVLARMCNELMNLHYCEGSNTHRDAAKQIEAWKVDLSDGKLPKRASLCKKLIPILDQVGQRNTGNLLQDSKLAINLLANETSSHLAQLNSTFSTAPPFEGDARFVGIANDLYAGQGNYSGLKDKYVEYATQKRASQTGAEYRDVMIMTMHKSKGREYDGVILFDGPYDHTMLLPNDYPTYAETRMLVRVAMTRARHYVSILHPEGALPPIFKC